MMKTGAHYELDRVGVFRPGKLVDIDELSPGEVGFFTASIKTVADCSVGDTVTDDRKPAEQALPGFREVQPVVFCGLFPVDAAKFEDLRAAMGKLRLNDASFTCEMETSAALGFGFRCGFLGLLHLEIIQERLSPRVRPRPHRDRAVGDLRDPHDRRLDHRAAQPGRHAGRREASPTSTSRGSRRPSSPPTNISAASSSSARTAAASRRN